MNEKPLAGILVVDLTRILAGPYCTMVLKNLGAGVIKIERPGIGDEARFTDPFLDTSLTKSAYFTSVNSGKFSLALDVKSEGGRLVLADLIRKADVLVENFKPGTMDRLSFTPERIRELNPNLIFSSISGFGHTGPLSPKPAFDMIIQALSGLVSITGLPGGRTTRVGTSISDIMAGVFAVVGILAALYRRGRLGEGARVDVAMLDSSVAILENAIARFQIEGVPGPIGTRHPSITPFGAFTALDGEFIISAGTDKLFAELCRVIGRKELITDDRFLTNHLRTVNVDQLTALLNQALVTKPIDHWLPVIEKVGVPCSRINTVADLFEEEQLKVRNMLLPIKDETEFKIAGNPIKFGGLAEDNDAGRYPRLGEHNDLVLREILGYTPGEIETLYESGALFGPQK